MRNKLFKYFGAKTRFLDQIYRNFPMNFRKMKYCSVFGGSGIDLYFKPRSIEEIYNDINKGLSSVFWCLINEYDEFVKQLENCIYSENIFKWFLEFNPKNRLELAVKTIFIYQFSFQGRGNHFFKALIMNRGLKGRDKTLFHPELFKKWKKRFLGIQIFNEDFRSFISKTDESNNLYYLDPPYIISTKSKTKGGYYDHNFSMKDHQDLLELLSSCKSKWLLSYDNDKWILDKYSNFNIKEITVHYTSQNQGKSTELLISNYPFPKHNPLLQKRTVSLLEFI